MFFHVAFPGVTADGCMRMQELLRASGTNHDLLSLNITDMTQVPKIKNSSTDQ